MGYFTKGSAGAGRLVEVCPHGVTYERDPEAGRILPRHFCSACQAEYEALESARRAAYDAVQARAAEEWERLPLLNEVAPAGRVQTYDDDGCRDAVIEVADYCARHPDARLTEGGGIITRPGGQPWDRLLGGD